MKEAFATDFDTFRSKQDVYESVKYCLTEVSQFVGTAAESPSDNPTGDAVESGRAEGQPHYQRSGGSKRPWDPASESTQEGLDCNDDGDTAPSVASAKRHKVENVHTFSCPYRKKNPLRFNVRKHQICATRSYTKLSDVKYVEGMLPLLPLHRLLTLKFKTSHQSISQADARQH